MLEFSIRAIFLLWIKVDFDKFIIVCCWHISAVVKFTHLYMEELYKIDCNKFLWM